MGVFVAVIATFLFFVEWSEKGFASAIIAVMLFLVVILPMLFIIRKGGKLAFKIFHGKGSGETDHNAVKAGMYNLARGYLRTSEHIKAEGKYLEILKQYPNEMDVHYYLGMLYAEAFNKPEKALIHFRKLNRKIKNSGSEYQYQDAVRGKIEDLVKDLGAI